MRRARAFAVPASSRCSICGGEQWTFVRSGCDLYHSSAGEVFALGRCVACGQIMQNPVPTAEQLSKAYSAHYAPYRPAWKVAGSSWWKLLRHWTTSRRMQRLKRHVSGKRLLEVGCGAGDFLYAAHRAGWDVKAVEYSDVLAAALRIELDFDVRTGDLVAGLWPAESFDAIVMWSVLEHLQDPGAALVAAASYLKPGGALLLQIPTLYGVQQGTAFGQYWALLDLPRHLSFIGKQLLADLCDRAGMKLTLFQTPLLESAWCYYASIANYGNHRRPPFRRGFGLFTLTLISALSFPLTVLRSWRGRGTEAFALAVKR